MSLTYLQADRPMRVTTPLGPDVLLMTGFTGEEGISRLFRFQLDLAAEEPGRVEFDKLLGKAIQIHLAIPGDDEVRHFGGICASLAQGMPHADLTTYRMEVVPNFWFLTRRAQSRIFQHLTVPEILRQVLKLPDVTYELDGSYHPRDFCVQYRETDFQFASRLMEEEGIYYYFRHDDRGHHMVVSDRTAFPELRPALLILHPIEGKHIEEERVTSWEKRQRLCSGQVTLRDHTFELPHKPLEAVAGIQESVQVGQVTHKLKIGRSDRLELYDWPGTYAGRIDGVDDSGADRPAELEHIFQDKERTAAIRIQQEASESVEIQGMSRYRHLSSGHAFLLSEEVWAPYSGKSERDGWYVLTSIRHAGRMADTFRSGEKDGPLYENAFTCVPAGLPYRPRRETPKPIISGTQTAVVVGPPGEEIHTDKYGRIKVQFHWDRQGRNDDESSCWIRVAQIAAGGGFGGVHLPRVGHEVVVAFEEGDPDRPIVVGCVYNPSQMPPYPLPASKMISGLRSNTYPGGGGMNEISVNDTKGQERMFINSQFNQDSVTGNNRTAKVGVDSTEEVGNNVAESVGNNKQVQIGNNSAETVGNGMTLNVGTTLNITAGTSITLSCGASTIHMNQAGFITISGTVVTMAGSVNANVAAPLTNIAGAVMLTCTGALNLVNGVVTRVEGSSLGHFGGGKAELIGGGETLVQGGTVKIN